MTPGNLSEITKVFGMYMEQIKIYAMKDSNFLFFLIFLETYKPKTGTKKAIRVCIFLKKLLKAKQKALGTSSMTWDEDLNNHHRLTFSLENKISEGKKVKCKKS